jgi:hypothetical protein
MECLDRNNEPRLGARNPRELVEMIARGLGISVKADEQRPRRRFVRHADKVPSVRSCLDGMDLRRFGDTMDLAVHTSPFSVLRSCSIVGSEFIRSPFAVPPRSNIEPRTSNLERRTEPEPEHEPRTKNGEA